jgi:hypothetical protein
MAKVKLLAYALFLLALAHPAIVPPVLGTLGALAGVALAIVGWALANISLTLTMGAGVLLARVFPGALGRGAQSFRRALTASLAAVAPRVA